MADIGGHDMGGSGGMSMDTAPAAVHSVVGRRKHYMHMTFCWGKNSEILFTEWPGISDGMWRTAAAAMGTLGVVHAVRVGWCTCSCRSTSGFLSFTAGVCGCEYKKEEIASAAYC
uniref:Uncharacterized protein n=1 Tax=Oryza punctata TaxID=4537 RepID=A0A0E0KFH2_ORYPU